MKKLLTVLLVCLLGATLTGCKGRTLGDLTDERIDEIVDKMVEEDLNYDGYEQSYFVDASYSNEAREAEGLKQALRDEIKELREEYPEYEYVSHPIEYNGEEYRVTLDLR